MTRPYSLSSILPVWLTAIVLSITLLTACGGGGGSAGRTADVPDASVPPVLAPTQTPSPITGRGVVLGLVDTGPADVVADSDADGLPDALDPFPAVAPVFPTHPGDADLLDAYAHSAQGAWSGLMHADLATRFRVAGVLTSPAFAVFAGVDERAVVPLNRVPPVTAEESTVFEIAAGTVDFRPTSVYLMNASARTRSLPLESRSAASPLVLPPSAVMRGEILNLHGHHLEAATVQLDGQPLDVLERAEGAVDARIPDDARSGTLQVSTPGQQPFETALTVLRGVPLLRAAQDPRTEGVLSFAAATGYRRWPASAAELRVPVQTTQPTRATLTRPAADPDLLPTDVVIWPDEDRVVLTAERFLEGWIFDQLQRHARMGAEDWRSQRERVRAVLHSPAAQVARDAIAHGLADPSSFRAAPALLPLRERLWAQQVERKRFQTRGQDIYDVVVTTEAGGEIDPRPEFKGFTVDENRSVTCQASVDFAPVTPIASNLCLENDSAAFASAAVDVGRLDVAASEFRYARARSHIPLGSTFETAFSKDVVGGLFGGVAQLASVAYLTDDNGQPLCGLRRCRVELLTGGFAQGWNEVLTGPERQRADALFQRTMIESVVLPLIDKLSGNVIGAAGDKTCVAQEVFKKTTRVLSEALTLRDFNNKLGGNTSLTNIASVVSDTYLKTAIDEVLSGLPSIASKCAISADAADDIAARFASQAARRLFFVVDVVQTIVNIEELRTTPSKIVFDVRPFAEITDADRELDLSLQLPQGQINGIAVRGEFIAADTPAEEAFYPTLVLRDAGGATSRTPLGPENFSNPTNSLSLDGKTKSSTLIAPVSDLVGVANLRPGLIEVRLEVSGYPELPGGVLPIPGPRIVLRRAPFISNIFPTAAKPGEQIALRGYRLAELLPGPQETASVIFSPSADARPGAVGTSTARLRAGTFMAVGSEAGQDLDPLDLAALFADFSTQIELNVPQDIFTNSRFDLALDTPSAPDPVPASVALFVIGGLSNVATIADVGLAADDAMTLQLTDATGRVLEAGVDFDPGTSALQRAEIQIPFNNAFSNSVFWDPIELPVRQLRVRCDDGGDDGACTFGLTVTRAGDSGSDIETGKIPTGETEGFPAP